MFQRSIVLLSTFSAGLLLLLLYSRTATTAGLRSFTSSRLKPGSKTKHESNLHARLSLAETVWEQAAKDRKLMVEQMGYDRKFPDGYINPFHVWDFARPSFFCPHDLQRVGKLGDGGKVLCGMSRYEHESPGPSSKDNPARDLVMYSFGVSRDSTFEAAMLERTNIQIWGYDYSVDHWGEGISSHQRANFSKMGIGKETDLSASPPMSTIHDLMKANGHSFIDIMKMDIEGAEFNAFNIFDRVGSEGAWALLVEIHFMKEREGLSIPQDLSSWLKWWASLEKMGLRPVNNEDNWIGDAVYGKPRFMEYTLINVWEKDKNLLLWE